MPINVNQQIQEAMARGDFDNLPGKGKPLKLADNPFIPHDVRMINQLLRDNGFAPRWIEIAREIQAESEQLETLLATLRGRRERLSALIRLQPFKHRAIGQTFELERARALERYSRQLRTLNEKIQRFNLIVPVEGKQQPLHNMDAAIARFHKECPSL